MKWAALGVSLSVAVACGCGCARPAKAPPPTDERSAYPAAFDDYRKSRDSMSPSQQATSWIKLYLTVTSDSNVREMQNFRRALLAELPPPEAWPELSTQADAAATTAGTSDQIVIVQLLGRMLNGDPQGEYDLLKARVKRSTDADAHPWLTAFSDLAVNNCDAEGMVEALRAEADHGGPFDLQIPALVPVYGRERSRAILTELLPKAFCRVSLTADKETRILASEVALDMIGHLRYPQWNLAYSVETTDLYLALRKRFAHEKGQPSQEREAADADYAVKRIMRGEGSQVATELLAGGANPLNNEDLFDYGRFSNPLERVDAMYAFLSKLLTSHPSLPLWKPYVELAKRTGHVKDMASLLPLALSQKRIADEYGWTLRDELWHALLETGNVAKGIAMLRKAISERRVGQSQGISDDQTLKSWGLELARVGKLTKNEAWVKEGLAVAGEPTTALDVQPGQLELAKEFSRALLWTHASEILQSYLRTTPEDTDGELRLARLLFMLGDRSRAKEIYKDAFGKLARGPVMSSDASYYLKEKMSDAFVASVAEPALEQAIADQPSNANAHLILGQLYEARWDNFHAAKEYGAALHLAPERLIREGCASLRFYTPAEVEENARWIAQHGPGESWPVQVRDYPAYWRALNDNFNESRDSPMSASDPWRVLNDLYEGADGARHKPSNALAFTLGINVVNRLLDEVHTEGR